MSWISSLTSILMAVLGLGMVIFFHELGHFAVAKWCDVYVERFSIGFGPILWRWKRNETEYALSAIPFGGYVQMLGQDDMDPSQLSNEEISKDPRSYSAKSVPQRMAIISAGVIMNVITGLIFFAIAYGIGLEQSPSTVGMPIPGKPGWEAGLETGDHITRINGEPIKTFNDLTYAIVLSSGDLKIEGVKSDGRKFETSLSPDSSGELRQIGVEPLHGLDLYPAEVTELPVAIPGTPAATASPPLKAGDVIVAADGEKLKDYVQLQRHLAEHATRDVVLTVERKQDEQTTSVDITLQPNPFRTIGIWPEIGQVVAIRKNSPAAKAGFQKGDKITHVEEQAIGNDLNPLRLPDYLSEQAGNEITLTVSRPVKGGEPEELTLTVIPENKSAWTEPPRMSKSPLSIPSIGLAYNVIPTVIKVESGSPAEKQGIKPGDLIKQVEFILPPGAESDALGQDFSVPGKSDEKNFNWAYAFWMMQRAPTRVIRLTVSSEEARQKVEVEPQVNTELAWYQPTRGLILTYHRKLIQAGSVPQALYFGLLHTKKMMIGNYLTIKSLVTGEVSVYQLHGPLDIAKQTYTAANLGPSYLLLFLGLLSVNLAVINFLPIPILDGGHMVFLCWEAVTKKKPSEKVLIGATYIGLSFILCIMMLVIYLDIFVHWLGMK